MYSIRPYSSENIKLDLPTTMYSIRPIIQQIEKSSSSSSTNELLLKDIQRRQDILLEKIEHLYNEISHYQKIQNKDSNEKVTKLLHEELVVHLSAKQPSKDILNLIEQFRDKLSIRTYCHSSLRATPVNNQLQNYLPSSTHRSLTIIWADNENLPFMFHSNMNLNDEQSIVNLLSQHLTNSS